MSHGPLGEQQRRDRLSAFAAAATGVQVGTALVAARFAMGQSEGPGSLAMLRYFIGFLCLLPFVVIVGRRGSVRRGDILPIALIGIFQFAGVVALLNYSLQFIAASRAALIFATFPLMTMLLAAAFGHERLTWAKAAGVALTIAGVALALGEKALHATPGGGEAWLGELAALLAAFCGALSSVLYRPYLRRNSPLSVGALAMLASVAFLAILAAFEGFFDHAPRYTAFGWAAVVFIGVSSGVFYYLWLWALERTAATKVTVFLALSPITAAILGVALLGERATLLLAAGLAAVVAGLWLALREPPKTNPKTKTPP